MIQALGDPSLLASLTKLEKSGKAKHPSLFLIAASVKKIKKVDSTNNRAQ